MRNTPVDVAEDVLPMVDTDDQEMLGVQSVGPRTLALSRQYARLSLPIGVSRETGQRAGL
jgi:hypothetical protein